MRRAHVPSQVALHVRHRVERPRVHVDVCVGLAEVELVVGDVEVPQQVERCVPTLGNRGVNALSLHASRCGDDDHVARLVQLPHDGYRPRNGLARRQVAWLVRLGHQGAVKVEAEAHRARHADGARGDAADEVLQLRGRRADGKLLVLHLDPEEALLVVEHQLDDLGGVQAALRGLVRGLQEPLGHRLEVPGAAEDVGACVCVPRDDRLLTDGGDVALLVQLDVREEGRH
mmetsp:Transcript_57736/g.171781  ORF Transcript_57736/g.171781 Transcript_57736/m.171781 type:complete len:230 (+) Transcript_57736:1123-1812(+)